MSLAARTGQQSLSSLAGSNPSVRLLPRCQPQRPLCFPPRTPSFVVFKKTSASQFAPYPKTPLSGSRTHSSMPIESSATTIQSWTNLHYIYGLLVSSDFSARCVVMFISRNSTVLDPRISYQGLLADCDNDTSLKDDIDSAKSQLEERYKSQYHREPRPLPTTSSRPSTSQQTNTSPQKVNFTARYQQRTPATHNELEEYFKLPQEDFEACNPLTWWAGRRGQFPNLSRFARDLLGIPGVFDYLVSSSIINPSFSLRLCCRSRAHLLGRSGHHFSSPSAS